MTGAVIREGLNGAHAAQARPSCRSIAPMGFDRSRDRSQQSNYAVKGTDYKPLAKLRA
jgi:hypothetical protein